MWKELNEVINLPCPQARPVQRGKLQNQQRKACLTLDPSPLMPQSGDREVTQFMEWVRPHTWEGVHTCPSTCRPAWAGQENAFFPDILVLMTVGKELPQRPLIIRGRVWKQNLWEHRVICPPSSGAVAMQGSSLLHRARSWRELTKSSLVIPTVATGNMQTPKQGVDGHSGHEWYALMCHV